MRGEEGIMSLRRTLPSVVFVAFAVVVANSACSTTEPVAAPAPPPPRVCKVPGATPAKWFTDATADFGLSGAGV